jgi:tripartite-type tricarboxylate transporter receptor subunit TctC
VTFGDRVVTALADVLFFTEADEGTLFLEDELDVFAVAATAGTDSVTAAMPKANPDKANYGSPAAGSTPHFLGALLSLDTGVPMQHVAYRGSVPGVTDVIGGQLAAMLTPHGDFLANHRAGKLRILATSGKARSPFVAEGPTFAEQGFADLTVEEWFGFFAPAKTPAPIVSAANAASRSLPLAPVASAIASADENTGGLKWNSARTSISSSSML